MNVAEFVGGKGHVAAIADDVNNQRFRNCLFDAMQVQQVLESSIGPALNSLLPGHLRHDDPKEVAAIPALAHYLGVDFLFIQAGQGIKAAVVPGLEQAKFIALDGQVPEPRLQKVDEWDFPVERRIAPLYRSLQQTVAAELAGYTDKELTLLLDFFTRAARTMVAETAKLRDAVGNRKVAKGGG